MKYIYVLMILFLCCICYGADLTIPYVQNNKFDTNIKSFEDALCIEHFNERSTLYEASTNTSLYLKYDNEFLYALFVCEEKNKNYPISFKRPKRLMVDDAVEIVLGTGIKNRVTEIMNMGGYEGAYSAKSNCDYYYEFIVNSQNFRERTFNERHVDRELFESLVRKENGKWFAALKIPFASCGIKDPKGKEIYFNAFRSRPPELQGYKNLYYGGYSPMPFADLKLGDSAELSETFTAKVPKPEKDIVSELSLRYYPAVGQIIGQAKVDNLSGEGTFSLESNKFETITENLENNKYSNLIFNVEDNISVPINAKCVLTLPDGTVKEETLTVDKIIPVPEAKIEHVGDEKTIPAPWSMPTISNDTINLYNKDIKIGKNGFFESVKGERELLSGEMYVDLFINGKKAIITPLKREIVPCDRGVMAISRVKVNSKFSLDIKIKVDFDGFSTVRFRSEDIDPETISKLSFCIPLKKENAKFINRYDTQNIFALDGFGYSGSGSAPLWIGCEDMGIGVENEFDNNLFFSQDKRNQLEIIEGTKNTLVKFNFIDGKGQLTDKGYIFRFYLTPTPTKKTTLNKQGLFHGTDLWFEEWSDYQGYPDLTKIPAIKKRYEEDKKKDINFMLYFSQVLAENSPVSGDYFNDLTLFPKGANYKRAYDPGKGVPCYVSCLRDYFGDVLLDGMKKIMDETGTNSVYFDGPANYWQCENPSHVHCSARVENTWDDDTVYPYEGTRNFLIRFRNLLASSGRPFQMISHTGGILFPGTLSLMDVHWEGEQMARFKRGYKIPLESFAVGYSGLPYGFRVDSLAISSVYTEETMRALTMLHNGSVATTQKSMKLEDRVYGDFQNDAETKYYPYFKQQDLVKHTGNSLLSFYLNKDKSMLIFGNITDYTDNVSCDVTGLFGNNVILTDMSSMKKIRQTPDNITFSLEPYHYKIIKVETEDNSEPEEMLTLYGVGGLVDTPIGKGVQAVKQKVESTITINKKVAKGIKIEGKVYHTDIWTINFGETRLIFQQGYLSLIQRAYADQPKFINYSIVSWPFVPIAEEGYIHRMFHCGKEGVSDIKMSVVDDRLDLIIDGKTVAKNWRLCMGKEDKIFFETWENEKLAFAPSLIEKCDTPIFPVEEIQFQDFDINSAADFVGGNIRGNEIELESSKKDSFVSSEFNYNIGENLYFDLDVERDKGFYVKVGNTRITFSDDTQTVGYLDSWNEGQVYKYTGDVPKKVNIKACVTKGDLMDVIVDGKILAENVKVDFDNVKRLSFNTDSKIKVIINQVSSQEKDLLPKIHPIL